MKRFILTSIVLLFALMWSSVVQAQMASVQCQGKESGGVGPWLYQYDVNAQMPFTQFEVGTDDPNPVNYSNWTQPSGWTWQIVTNVNILHWPEKTPHGFLSPGPLGWCPYKIVWTGPAVPTGLFGYDNQNSSHDVGWFVGGPGLAAMETWAAPVGIAFGPVHGPVPEPASILAMTVGLAGFALKIRKS